MNAMLRAGALAALVTLASGSALAAGKAFQRADLDDYAVKLEAKLKSDVGAISKPLATLKREADTALEQRDWRGAMKALSVIAVVAPRDSTNWIRLARTMLQVRDLTWHSFEGERTRLIESAATS